MTTKIGDVRAPRPVGAVAREEDGALRAGRRQGGRTEEASAGGADRVTLSPAALRAPHEERGAAADGGEAGENPRFGRAGLAADATSGARGADEAFVLLQSLLDAVREAPERAARSHDLIRAGRISARLGG